MQEWKDGRENKGNKDDGQWMENNGNRCDRMVVRRKEKE